MVRNTLLWTALFLIATLNSAGAFYDPNNPDIPFLLAGSYVAESNNDLYGPASWTSDGSGMVGNKHQQSSWGGGFWLSGGYYGTSIDPEPAWILYDLQRDYIIEEIWVWNNNQTGLPERGCRWVTLEYSSDKQNWTSMGDYELDNAPPDQDPYDVTTQIDAGNITARYVRFTGYPVEDPCKPGTWQAHDPQDPYAAAKYYGLAEVKFAVQAAPIVNDPPTEQAIHRDDITVSVSGLAGGELAWVVNYAGMDMTDFTHVRDPWGGGMWLSSAGGGGYAFPHDSGVVGPAWIQFDFDQSYSLGECWVWNGNQNATPEGYGSQLSRGLKLITVVYTNDGSTWNVLPNGGDDQFQVGLASGEDGMVRNLEFDFGGVDATAVAFIADPNEGNWGDASYYCLSEVRFGIAGTPYPPALDAPVEDMVPAAAITVSSSDQLGGESSWLVDAAGLYDNYHHIVSTYGEGMLLNGDAGATNPAGTAGPAWILCEFDRPYDLGTMWAWNYNQVSSTAYAGGETDRGLRNVTIQYSPDGVNWNTLGDYEFAEGAGWDHYAHNTEVDFGGVTAQAVLITAKTVDGNWGSGDGGDDAYYGLSELRFGLANTSWPVGDTDGDGDVDFADLADLVGNWLASSPGCGQGQGPVGDWTYDCVVNLDDYAAMGANWMFGVQ